MLNDGDASSSSAPQARQVAGAADDEDGIVGGLAQVVGYLNAEGLQAGGELVAEGDHTADAVDTRS